MIKDDNIIPVIMLHSVGAENSDWVFSYVSEPIYLFEQKIKLLRKKNYNFILWDDLYNHMSGNKKLPKKSIMLTFDDGYLDNWVNVYPILRKYDAKATIFVNPDFVDTSEDIRPNRENGTNKSSKNCHINDLGFLNWNEMKMMERSGLVDIQSHSMTHTWYPSSDKIIDFVDHGDKKYPWIAWNKDKSIKPYYINIEYSNLLDPGMPVYEFEKSLICRRCFPSTKISEELIQFAKNNKKKFLELKDWKIKIREYANLLKKKYSKETIYETEEDYRDRVYNELFNSKKIIEEKLEKRVDYICWPGGGYNNLVCEIAKEIGYKAWPISLKDNKNYKNRFNSDPQKIIRIPTYHRYKGRKGKKYGFANELFFYNGIRTHTGSKKHKIMFKGMQYYGRLKGIINNKI